MYFPLAKSASKLLSTVSSSPTLAGVPFTHPFVGQLTAASAVTVGSANARRPLANKITMGNKITPATIVHTFFFVNF
jgi:hypothetical protein